MCWKEIFPNEDASRFDLVDELYALLVKLPANMYQFASWNEDWMTKLVVADEVSAHIEPRRAMAVLTNVGKPLQSSDNIFMTELGTPRYVFTQMCVFRSGMYLPPSCRYVYLLQNFQKQISTGFFVYLDLRPTTKVKLQEHLGDRQLSQIFPQISPAPPANLSQSGAQTFEKQWFFFQKVAVVTSSCFLYSTLQLRAWHSLQLAQQQPKLQPHPLP